MKRTLFPKFLAGLLLPILAAGFVPALPGAAAPAAPATVASFPGYCDVSGITSPADGNGHYVLAGSSADGTPLYQYSTTTYVYRLEHQTENYWYIAQQNGPSTFYPFYNTSTDVIPPSSGWNAQIGASGSVTVICGSVPASHPAPTEQPKAPITFVSGNGQSVNLSCQHTLSVGLTSSGGNMALFTCPVSGLASNDKLAQDKLPGALPGGTFVAGMDVEIRGLTLTRSPWTVTFQMPEGVTADKLSILYWDGTAGKWIELPALGNPATYQVVDLGGGRKVLTGVHQYTRTHISATVNFTGTFVLVQK